MKHTTISMFIAALALVQPGAKAQPFTLTLKTFNAATNQPQTAFHPGDKVLLSFKTDLPDAAAANKKMSLAVFATAKVAGVAIPYTISDANSLQNTNPTLAGNPALFQSGTETRVITIPAISPDATLKVVGDASIRLSSDHIQHASCTAKVVIKR